MPMNYLLFGLMSVLLLQTGGGAPIGTATVAPGSRVPQTVSKEPAVVAAVYLLRLPTTSRVEVFAVVYPREVQNRVTPETIEEDYDYRISTRGPFPLKLQGELAHALETTPLDRVDETGSFSCNWAVVFYDMKGERVMAMYFGAGKGLINGARVAYTGPITDVLQRRCAPLWE